MNEDMKPTAYGGADALFHVLVTCPTDPSFEPREIEITPCTLALLEASIAEFKTLEPAEWITIPGRPEDLTPEGRVRWAAMELADAITDARSAALHVDLPFTLSALASIAISETAAVAG